MPELRALAERAAPMAIGPVIRVEQTQPLEIGRIVDSLAEYGIGGDNIGKRMAG
ncbi:hypothetical protein D3C80_2219350 [compost metagenome]